MSGNLEPISVKITEKQLVYLDELMRQEVFATRSEAIRTALRDLIQKYKGKY